MTKGPWSAFREAADTLGKVGRPAPSDQKLMAMQAALMRLLARLRHLSSLERRARSLPSGRPSGIKSQNDPAGFHGVLYLAAKAVRSGAKAGRPAALRLPA